MRGAVLAKRSVHGVTSSPPPFRAAWRAGAGRSRTRVTSASVVSGVEPDAAGRPGTCRGMEAFTAAHRPHRPAAMPPIFRRYARYAPFAGLLLLSGCVVFTCRI